MKQKHSTYGGRLWPQYTRADRMMFRFLKRLYPDPAPPNSSGPSSMLADHPFVTAPLAEDGNLYPYGSRLRTAPMAAGLEIPKDFEEFVCIPPNVIGNPNGPDAIWLDENLQRMDFS